MEKREDKEEHRQEGDREVVVVPISGKGSRDVIDKAAWHS